MAASLLYYKGLRIEGSKQWPHIDNWFANMSKRPTFRMIRSDYFTHVHDLPPQLGGCVENNTQEQIDAMSAINGRDGKSWQLPLPPLNESSAGTSLGERKSRKRSIGSCNTTFE